MFTLDIFSWLVLNAWLLVNSCVAYWQFSCCQRAGTVLRQFSFLVSLFVSLVLCDAAAGGEEAAVLARLHHVALPPWAVSGRLRSSCATAVEAAVVAAVVAAGRWRCCRCLDGVLGATVVGAAVVPITVSAIYNRTIKTAGVRRGSLNVRSKQGKTTTSSRFRIPHNDV